MRDCPSAYFPTVLELVGLSHFDSQYCLSRVEEQGPAEAILLRQKKQGAVGTQGEAPRVGASETGVPAPSPAHPPNNGPMTAAWGAGSGQQHCRSGGSQAAGANEWSLQVKLGKYHGLAVGRDRLTGLQEGRGRDEEENGGEGERRGGPEVSPGRGNQSSVSPVTNPLSPP